MCLTEYNSSINASLDADMMDSACVRLPFLIKLDSNDAKTYNGTMAGLTGALSGSMLKTKITGEKIGGKF